MKKKIPQLGKTEHDLDPFALTIGTSFKFSKKKNAATIPFISNTKLFTRCPYTTYQHHLHG